VRCCGIRRRANAILSLKMVAGNSSKRGEDAPGTFASWPVVKSKDQMSQPGSQRG
jgi:hypothetical protein